MNGCAERIVKQTVDQYVEVGRSIPEKVVEIVEVPASHVHESGHQCTVEQMDDFLVQHVAECTMEEITEVRLIPQRCFQEQRVQVNKVMP